MGTIRFFESNDTCIRQLDFLGPLLTFRLSPYFTTPANVLCSGNYHSPTVFPYVYEHQLLSRFSIVSLFKCHRSSNGFLLRDDRSKSYGVYQDCPGSVKLDPHGPANRRGVE